MPTPGTWPAPSALTRLRLRPLSEWPMGQKVRVYRNLNNGKWSVKHGDKPVFHCDAVHLKDVRFVVSEAGVARVRKKGQREVHAYAEGIMCIKAEAIYCTIVVSYNPFHGDTFNRFDTGKVVTSAYFAAFETREGYTKPECFINDLPF